jgi:hypothetical protein
VASLLLMLKFIAEQFSLSRYQNELRTACNLKM